MNNHFDLLIIGAGPSGCLAAAGALKSNPNLKVGIIEPKPEDKHRIGEALLTGTIYTLQDAGLLDVLGSMKWHRKIGAAYRWGESSEPWYVNYPLQEVDGEYPQFMQDKDRRYTIHVPRHKFDAELLKQVCSKYGANLIKNRVRKVGTAGNKNPIVKNLLLDNGEVLTANYFIDCSGQNSVLGRAVTERRPIFERRHAKYGYYDCLNWEKATANGYDLHRTNIISTKNGWAWFIHLGEVGDNLTSVGVVSDKELIDDLTIDNILELFPELETVGLEVGMIPKTYDGSSVLNKFYRHPDYSFKCEQIHGRNWALSGDAGLFLDPILSQGATLACHYGFMRGIAAAQHLKGDASAQENVTKHYLNEAAVLADMVGFWYENNKQASDWRLRADNYCNSGQSDKPFMWVTNLENIRSEYRIYPETEELKIQKALAPNQA